MAMLSTRKAARLPSLWSDPFTALRQEMKDLRSLMLGQEDQGWFDGALVPAIDLSESV